MTYTSLSQDQADVRNALAPMLAAQGAKTGNPLMNLMAINALGGSGFSPLAFAALSDQESTEPQGIFGQGSAVGSVSDRELLAKTLMAEAGGEGEIGMLAAGSVIANRVRNGGYGDGVQGVIMKPGQFSAWNSVTGYAGGEGGIQMDKVSPSASAYRVADLILSGQYRDPTGGATHYYNDAVADPAWGRRAGGNWQRIGNHIFGFADAGRS